MYNRKTTISGIQQCARLIKEIAWKIDRRLISYALANSSAKLRYEVLTRSVDLFVQRMHQFADPRVFVGAEYVGAVAREIAEFPQLRRQCEMEHLNEQQAVVATTRSNREFL